jgi:tripartite-type tricarboxylate transporter receptor subunit TctC
VLGYQGSHDEQLAMERDEVQGICLAYGSLLRGTLARERQINILLQASLEPGPRLQDVPSALQFGGTPDQSRELQLFFARASIGRPFVPPDRIAALRRAFSLTLKDPDFLDDARRQSLNVVPVAGEQMADIIAKAYQTAPAVVKRSMQAME